MRQLRYWQLFSVSPETFSVCMVPKIAHSGADEMAQELRALAVHSKDLVWSPAHSSNVSGEDLITAQHQNLHLPSGWLSRTEIQLERCWWQAGGSTTAAPVGYCAVFCCCAHTCITGQNRWLRSSFGSWHWAFRYRESYSSGKRLPGQN